MRDYLTLVGIVCSVYSLSVIVAAWHSLSVKPAQVGATIALPMIIVAIAAIALED